MVIGCTAMLHFQDGRTCVQTVSDFGIPVQLAKAGYTPSDIRFTISLPLPNNYLLPRATQKGVSAYIKVIDISFKIKYAHTHQHAAS